MLRRRSRQVTKERTTKRKRSHDIIEKQQVKFRLMEISLKVDDHIYQNNLIPAKTAALYNEEILQLKQRSGCDVHSLQVTEKLARFMKQIIVEEMESMESAGNVADSNNATVESIFAVQNPIEYVNLSDEGTENSKQEVVATKKSNSECVKVVDLSSAINSLSMNHSEIDLLPLDNSTQDYSQSILTFNTEQLNNGQGFEEYDRAWQNAVTHDTAQCSSLKSDLSTSKYCLEEVAQTFPTPNKIAADNPAKPKRYAPKKACCKTTVKTNKVNNTRKKIKPTNEQVNKRRSTKYPTAKTAPVIKHTENNVATANPLQIMTNTTHSPILTTDVKLHNPSHSKVNLSMPNYTPLKITQEDLSWVEDIKYVREVHTEEYVPLDGLTESFWNNCEFPPDWDEGHFSFL